MIQVFNVAVSALVITFSAWLSRRYPAMAGFFVAMPVATLLVLPLAQAQHGESANTILLARSIFVAIPVTLTFFVPFLLADRLGLSFWPAYALGCAALPVGFLVHRFAVRLFW